MITKWQILSFTYCYIIIGERICMQKQLPKQFATLKVKVQWQRKLHRNGSSVSTKVVWILKTGHVPDYQRFWTKETYKPLWMLSRHQAHANWLKNLVLIRRQFGIISSNLTLSTKSHDKIYTSWPKRKPPTAQQSVGRPFLEANFDIRREVGLPGQSRSKQALDPQMSDSSIRSRAKSIWKEDHDLRLVELRRNLAF